MRARKLARTVPSKGGWSTHEAALLQAADDLFENSVVSDATWAALNATYGTEQMMDVVFTIGQYNLVSSRPSLR